MWRRCCAGGSCSQSWLRPAAVHSVPLPCPGTWAGMVRGGGRRGQEGRGAGRGVTQSSTHLQVTPWLRVSCLRVLSAGGAGACLCPESWQPLPERGGGVGGPACLYPARAPPVLPVSQTLGRSRKLPGSRWGLPVLSGAGAGPRAWGPHGHGRASLGTLFGARLGFPWSLTEASPGAGCQGLRAALAGCCGTPAAGLTPVRTQERIRYAGCPRGLGTTSGLLAPPCLGWTLRLVGRRAGRQGRPPWGPLRVLGPPGWAPVELGVAVAAALGLVVTAPAPEGWCAPGGRSGAWVFCPVWCPGVWPTVGQGPGDPALCPVCDLEMLGPSPGELAETPPCCWARAG